VSFAVTSRTASAASGSTRGASNYAQACPSACRRPGGGRRLAIDLMTNTAVTGATFDIDGGQQLIEA
jgi:hypothetical protein